MNGNLVSVQAMVNYMNSISIMRKVNLQVQNHIIIVL